MGVAVEFQQASLGYLSVSGENATQQRHGEASSHLPVSPASPSSTTEREWTSTPRRQFVELGDGRQQQRRTAAANRGDRLLARGGRRPPLGFAVRCWKNRGRRSPLYCLLLETAVAESSPLLPETGEEVTGLGDGAVGPVNCCREGSASCCYATRLFVGTHRRPRTLAVTTIAALLVVMSTREKDRGRRLLLRSASCYDVRVEDDWRRKCCCIASPNAATKLLLGCHQLCYGRRIGLPCFASPMLELPGDAVRGNQGSLH
nr:hypothetical protein Iba_chr09eCG12120 [Ipomoea batatas]